MYTMVMKIVDIMEYENLYQITDTGVVVALEKSENEKQRELDLLKLREEIKAKLEIEHLKLKNNTK